MSLPPLTCAHPVIPGRTDSRRAALAGWSSGRRGPGADQRHVAQQNVEELGQFIDARRAEETPDDRGPPITHRGPAIAVKRRPQCSVLVDQEWPPLPTGPLLPEQNRRADIEQDQKAGNQEDWKQQGDERQRGDKVEGTLSGKVSAMLDRSLRSCHGIDRRRLEFRMLGDTQHPR